MAFEFKETFSDPSIKRLPTPNTAILKQDSIAEFKVQMIIISEHELHTFTARFFMKKHLVPVIGVTNVFIHCIKIGFP